MPRLEDTGEFTAKVLKPTAGWFGETPEKQTPFIRVPLEITEGEHVGKHIMWTGWLSDKAIDSTIRTLTEAFGFNGDLNALSDGMISFEEQPCKITVEIESYNDKLQYKVRWLNNINRTGPAPMDAAKLKGLLSRLAPKAKAIAKDISPVVVATLMVDPDDDSSEVPF